MTATQETTAVAGEAALRLPARVRIVAWLSDYAAATTLIALLIVAGIATPSFFAGGNLHAVLLQASALGVVVLGQTVALLVRGLDMSVSAVVAFTGVLMVSTTGSGMAWVYVLLAVGIGVATGLANGLLVTWRRVPPFVASFAVLIVLDGVLLAYTRGQTSGSVPHWLQSFGSGSVLGVPTPVIVWVALILVLWVALHRTEWGRWVYATGSNPAAARHGGIPVTTVAVTAFVICALCAVVAGVLLSGYLGYVDQSLGDNVNLNSITAAIIGGVAFTGGRGSVWGAAIGALLLTVLVNVVVVAGLPLYWQLIATAVVLVVAVSIQGLRERWLSTSR